MSVQWTRGRGSATPQLVVGPKASHLTCHGISLILKKGENRTFTLVHKNTKDIVKIKWDEMCGKYFVNYKLDKCYI